MSDEVGHLDKATSLFKALTSPLRLSIILELRDGDRCVHELVERVEVRQALVSQHLRVLRGAGLVSTQRRGREIVYSLADDHVTDIVLAALEHTDEGAQP